DGIFCLPGFLAGERLAACRKDFARIVEFISTSPEAPERPMPWRYVGINYREYEYHSPRAHYTYHLQPFKHSKALFDVALDEFLLGIVARYFNRRFRLCEAGLGRYHPMPPRDFSSWMWHHDGLGPRINVMALFTDVGPNDQYMSYLKETHRLRHGYGIHNGKT